ncbi:hypothetical protein NLJ89_g786 [Agrocybe chaxingu]|uniref:F-box domain-containing protein n=1 Tax=Agrocybe chaxingu TaxID=84603 RepID=A0A9W8N151_9AGAR|nr:hypothetical protein NLJ89_g786 [Agrocybe chaxingu]
MDRFSQSFSPQAILKNFQQPAASQFEQFIGTNYVPTESQVSQLSTLLDEFLVKQNTLKAEISKIEAIYDSLLDQYEAFSTKIEAIRSLVSPMRRVPSDILREIFYHWRDLALSTPRLWAALHINTPTFQSMHITASTTGGRKDLVLLEANRRAAATNEWLGRSGVLPLSISLARDGWAPSEDSSLFFKPLIDSLLSVSSRWKRLDIAGFRGAFQEIARVNDVPLLESLSVNESLGQALPEGFETWLTSSLLKAPSLRMVSLCHATADPWQLPLNWSQLTSLSLKGPAMYMLDERRVAVFKLVSALRSCTRLISFYFEFFPRGGLMIEPNSYNEEDSSLALTMPSLTKLGSTCTDEAHAGRDDFTQDRLIPLLCHCPKLTFLSLLIDGDDYCGQTLDDHFLKSLVSPNEDGKYLCPSLDEWHCQGPTRFTDEGILDFITRKQDASLPQIAKLKRLHIAFTNRIHTVDISGKTEGFVEDGLDLQLSYSPDDIEAFARAL